MEEEFGLFGIADTGMLLWFSSNMEAAQGGDGSSGAGRERDSRMEFSTVVEEKSYEPASAVAFFELFVPWHLGRVSYQHSEFLAPPRNSSVGSPAF